MPVHYDNPAEVGADRIVNGVAAFEKYGGPCIVVDFGTATTFDCVSVQRRIHGRSHLPRPSVFPLTHFFSALPACPASRFASLRASSVPTPLAVCNPALYYGYLGLVDGILELLISELGSENKSDCHRRPGDP